MTPDISLGLNNTSSISQSLTTSLHNRLLSSSDFLYDSRNLACTLGGLLSYESGAYTGSFWDRCQHLECKLLNEKEKHKKLRKVPCFLVSQHTVIFNNLLRITHKNLIQSHNMLMVMYTNGATKRQHKDEQSYLPSSNTTIDDTKPSQSDYPLIKY